VYQVFDYEIVNVQTGPNWWTTQVVLKDPLPWTYYVSNAPNAYNYILKASFNTFIDNSNNKVFCKLYAELQKLDRYDWSKQTRVATVDYTVECGKVIDNNPICGPPSKIPTYAADIKTVNVTESSTTLSYKQYYNVVDCNGNVLGTGYDVIQVTLGADNRGNIYVRDANNPGRFCSYNNADSLTLPSGQMVLTCKK